MKKIVVVLNVIEYEDSEISAQNIVSEMRSVVASEFINYWNGVTRISVEEIMKEVL